MHYALVVLTENLELYLRATARVFSPVLVKSRNHQVLRPPGLRDRPTLGVIPLDSLTGVSREKDTIWRQKARYEAHHDRLRMKKIAHLPIVEYFIIYTKPKNNQILIRQAPKGLAYANDIMDYTTIATLDLERRMTVDMASFPFHTHTQ